MSKSEPSRPAPKAPRRLEIPVFLGEEVGLGEALSRLTRAAGIRSCAGCRRRAAALDRRLVLTPRR